jgi:hypothetical protein
MLVCLLLAEWLSQITFAGNDSHDNFDFMLVGFGRKLYLTKFQ